MPFIVLVPFAALFGLAIGSFLNVVIDRLPAGKSIAAGRSHCDTCGHALSPLDLVPVASYLALRGRCRYCGAAIPRRVLLVEAANGTLYALASWQFALTPLAYIVMAYSSILVLLFVMDLEHQYVFDVIIYPSLAVALIVAPWGPVGRGELSIVTSYGQALYGATIVGGLLFIMRFLAHAFCRKEAIGLGDVLIGILLGLMLGVWPAVVTLQLAAIVGGIVGIYLLVARIRRVGQAVPYGPFLTGAGIVGLFWGQWLYNWYLWYLGFFP